MSFEPVGQVAHDVADLRLVERLEDLDLRGLRPGVHEIGPQRVVEEVRILAHHPDDVP